MLLTGCSINPATGQQQFTGLMSAGQEAQIGASQHTEIVKEYGGLVEDQALQNYVNTIGQKLARNTERPEVQYQFYVLNSSIINAFALPGGYIYVTRGLMAVANSEAELASVLGHEIGHVTGRHQAARYSQGVVASLGTSILAAAVGSSSVTQIAGLGSNLYMSSYSRGQESEADALGIRYLNRSGYNTQAMASFLDAMGRYTETEGRLNGKGDAKFSYFSSHPQTGQRVAEASREAAKYPPGNTDDGRDQYLAQINGMPFGDDYDQGFVRGTSFLHPAIGFTFSVPQGYEIINQPEQVIAAGNDGTVIVLDTVNPQGMNPVDYMKQGWMEGKILAQPEAMTINGMQAATASFDGTLNGRPVEVRLVAIQWAPNKIFRFQFAIPRGVGGSVVEDLKRATYSFRQMTASEKASIKPQKLQIVTAGAADTVESLARRMRVEKGQVELFRALNGLGGGGRIQPGQKYKIVTQ